MIMYLVFCKTTVEHVYNEHGFKEISVVTKRFGKTVLNNIKPLVFTEILGANLGKICL